MHTRPALSAGKLPLTLTLMDPLLPPNVDETTALKKEFPSGRESLEERLITWRGR